MLLFQQIVNGLVIGSEYALIAIGLTMIYGALRILHIAHAAVYVFGAYFGMTVYKQTGNFALSMVGAMAFCGLVGIIIEKFVYRPMITRSRIVPLIASIGLLIAMQDSVRIIVTPLAESYPVSMGRGIQTSYLHLEGHAIFILVFTCVALFLLWVIMFRTKTGMSIRAVSQNLDISAVMGIDVNKANRIVFLIGSALAGAAGVLVGIHYNILLPFMGDVPAYKALAVIVIGGFGSVLGTILGGLFLGISEALISAYTDLPMSREATAMLLMIILILFRPQGLLGKK